MRARRQQRFIPEKKSREMNRRWRMSGEVEQAGSGESARKKEKQKKCDQPIRRQQWSVHDGMHRFCSLIFLSSLKVPLVGVGYIGASQIHRLVNFS